MDNKIGIGSRFRPSEIAEECNANVRLKQKLQKFLCIVQKHYIIKYAKFVI